jgi:hypothetical protein
MSHYKYYHDNNQRYNIYKGHFKSQISPKNYYEQIHNILLITSLALSLSISTLIAYDTYSQQVKESRVLLLNKADSQPLKNKLLQEIVHQKISDQVKSLKPIKTFSQADLRQIFESVMEKIQHTPHQIIYTSK